MLRSPILGLVLSVALARPLFSDCGMKTLNPKWFESDATHYAAVDLDGDGTPEIIGSSGTTVTYRRASALTPFIVYTGMAIGAPVAGDVTGDAKTDLVIPDEENDTLVVLPGNGDTTFGAAIVSNATVSPKRIVLGNFSGDANLDVGLIGDGASVKFLQGNGAGAFALAGSVAVAASPFQLISRDLDADGWDDVAVSHSTSAIVEILFANGSGGATSVSLSGGTSAHLAAMDVDGDGLLDLLSVRPVENRLDTFQNNGARSFTLASSTPIVDGGAGEIRSIVLGDVTNDLVPEVNIVRPLELDILRHTTAFNWDFGGQYSLQPFDVVHSARSVAAGDFTGDGRDDLAIESSEAGGGLLLRNACNPTSVFISSGLSKLSVGQTLLNQITAWANAKPSPTGTATVRWGDSNELTVTLVPDTGSYPRARASFQIAGLPAGLHELSLEYSGDSTHPPATNTTYVRVTTETTTTTLTGPTEAIYGDVRSDFVATTTSSTGETPAGTIVFSMDEVLFGSAPAPQGTWRGNVVLPAGNHTIRAHYAGSRFLPRSEPDSLEMVIRKATSSLSFDGGSMSRAGSLASIRVAASTQFTPAKMTGTLTLMEGATILGTSSAYSDSGTPNVTFNPAGLSTGTHRLIAIYSGDSNIEGSSIELDHTVLPADSPLLVGATAFADKVRLDYAYENVVVYRRTAGSAWSLVSSTGGTFFYDFGVVPGTVYQYRLEATRNGSTVTSNVETVYVGAFTDATLAGRTIKKVHFTEFQTALNAFRAMAGLPAMQIDFTGLVRASHIAQLRSAVNEARAALGMPVVAFGDAPVASVTLIRALDLLQLHDAIQ